MKKILLITILTLSTSCLFAQGSAQVTVVNHNTNCDVAVTLNAMCPNFGNTAGCDIHSNTFTVYANSSSPTWSNPDDFNTTGPGFASMAGAMSGPDFLDVTWSWTSAKLEFSCGVHCTPTTGTVYLREMVFNNCCFPFTTGSEYGTGCFTGPHTWTNVSSTGQLNDILIDVY